VRKGAEGQFEPIGVSVWCPVCGPTCCMLLFWAPARGNETLLAPMGQLDAFWWGRNRAQDGGEEEARSWRANWTRSGPRLSGKEAKWRSSWLGWRSTGEREKSEKYGKQGNQRVRVDLGPGGGGESVAVE